MPRYFIAVLPTAPISKEIVNLQTQIEMDFGAKHALNAPPHITIIPPFTCNEIAINHYSEALTKHLKRFAISKLKICLKNFQLFNEKTLFIDIEKNDDFEKFCKQIKLFHYRQKITPYKIDKHYFVPHITIANKDISKKKMKDLWQKFEYKTFEESFYLTNLTILKQGKTNWQIIKDLVV